MSFRKFITSFRYRRRLRAELERSKEIRPPANPSRRYLDKLVARLQNERKAYDARRELELIGPAAVPSLIAALDDFCFQRSEWQNFVEGPEPLDAMLELLVEHAPDEVVRIASLFVQSESNEVRETAALHLASAGRAHTIPILRELLQDEDGLIREYVGFGVDRAVSGGRADDSFRQQAYDLLLAQCDQDWSETTNQAASTVIVLDPARAAIDFASERWLNLQNPNVHQILEACNRANIVLPEKIVRRLLDAVLPKVVGESCYPHNYMAAAALYALALCRADGVGALAESLLNHENDKIKEAAGEALAIAVGVPDPIQFVIDRVQEAGYEALSHEQRVVYCAFKFDVEVCNGGLMQFFGNSSGDHAVDTLTALAELGHKESFEALDTAIKLVGPLAREADHEMRLTGFEGRWDELKPAFDPLEDAYYDSSAQLRQASLLYAVRHAEHFRH